MKYAIIRMTLGSSGVIDIDKSEYNLIKIARTKLFEAFYLEQKFDLVIENFYEYETELLSMASRVMIYQHADYFSMTRERDLINRRIVNLLGACRMYLRQSVEHIKNMYGKDSQELDLFVKEQNLMYDQNLGYRTMEALRNYVQHRNFPIHSIKFPQQKIYDREDIQFLSRVVPLINVLSLEEDGEFNKTILGQLKNIQKNNYVDFKPLIREHIECIGKVHEKARELTRQDLVSWENILDETIAKFQEKFGKEISTVSIATVNEEDGTWIEQKSIFKEFIQIRQDLERKNRSFINLKRRYVSNEIRDDV
jgi:hypothetical protein